MAKRRLKSRRFFVCQQHIPQPMFNSPMMGSYHCQDEKALALDITSKRNKQVVGL